MSIYKQIKETGVEIENHESDLYCKVTPETTQIIKEYQFKNSVTIFIYKGERWYDIPFAYDPYWKNKSPVKSK